ncbi:hypothetical protein T440DRAFT_386477 [Plenodomus tracheiphilus IPT5]|uniref:F-box domain-containing protein n=1 Tax=Plenodomus tracheiphilus IPT5 TaxID=1408161 RepID=A0A6A7BHM7_9PLEO|nr:hypothetical protein T440DRAFT_386477 [Plenodomus tracheiphilus IPT5]
MAVPRHESHPLTGVGPLASLQPQHPTTFPNNLPVELLHMVIDSLDDLPFAWFVLRHVSPLLRAVAEDFFRRFLLRTCSLTFTGQTIRELRYNRASPSPCPQTSLTTDMLSGCLCSLRYAPSADSYALKPTFRFRPSEFTPPSSKSWVVFKLHDLPDEYNPVFPPANQAMQASPNHHVSRVFFKPGPRAEILRRRLSRELHFVHFSNELRNIRLPTLMIDVAAREVLLDWQQLVYSFYLDKFKRRSHNWHT